VKLTTHFHLVPISRMRGAIPPLPNTPPLHGAYLKSQGLVYRHNCHNAVCPQFSRYRNPIIIYRQASDDISKSFRTESITIYKLTFGFTRSEATQRVMAAKLTRLTHKIVIQLHLVAELYHLKFSPRRPVRKLLDTSSYALNFVNITFHSLNTITWL
jgi:hypothetical protein